jgi:hypothetical protein
MALTGPPVVRQFYWSVCNNLLPTKHNLALKKIVPSLEYVPFVFKNQRQWSIVCGAVLQQW